MTLKASFAVVILATSCPIAVLSNPLHFLEPRAGSVCGSGIYGELAPILAGYPIAQAFCTAVYPVKCTTQIRRRGLATTTKSTTTPKTTSPTTTKITTTATTKKSITTTDSKASAWAKCQGQGVNVVSTMCSCIEAPPTACSTKPATTTTTTTTTSTPSGPHTVAAPTCNPNDDNNGGCSPNCSCADDYEGGHYCAGPFTYEDSSIHCTSNSECPQGDFCEQLDGFGRCGTGTAPGNVCTSSYAKKRSVFG